MTRINTVLFVAIAIVGLGHRPADAVGLFQHNTCDSADCDTCCSDTSCDALTCCDSTSACDACDSCGTCGNSSLSCGCLGRMKLLGFLKPSDQCFDDFVSPMINFAFFEDPRNLTEVRPIYLYHNLPGRVGSLGLPGGPIQLFAMQFRIALTQRLSLIAVKDGFIVSDLDAGPLKDLISDGWASVTAGLKYNVLRDTQRGRLASLGFTYEMPVGSRRTLQDIGDGQFFLFASGGQRLYGGKAHYLTSFGVRLPVDNDVQATSLNWSNHIDVRVTKRTYLVSELSWWHWTKSANNGAALGFAGQDLFNLSSTNVTGNDLITQNVGFKFKPSRNTELGVAYEFPLTGRNDIIQDRFQLDMIFRL